jgi:hypothetical protein
MAPLYARAPEYRVVVQREMAALRAIAGCEVFFNPDARRDTRKISVPRAPSREWGKARDFILDVMNNPSLPGLVRDRAALVALPLVHQRIAAPDEDDDSDVK